MIAIEFGGRLESGSVGTGTRLGQRIARNMLHGDQLGQEFRLHFSAAKAINHPARHIVDRDIGAGGRAAIGHGLHDQRSFKPAQIDAARFLGHINCAKTKFAGFLDHIAREMVVFVPFGGMRRDFVRGEFLRHLLDLALFVSQFELSHAAPIAVFSRNRNPEIDRGWKR